MTLVIPKRLVRLDRVEAVTVIGRRVRASEGLAVTSGGITVTAGGLTVTAGAVALPTGSLTHTALTVPAARVYHNANQNINPAAANTLAFNTERFDTDSMHSSGTNSRLTINTAGLYLFTVTLQYTAALACGRAITSLMLNGTDFIGRMETPKVAASSLMHTCTSLWQCVVGDYVIVDVYQDSAGVSAIDNVGAALSPEFSAVRVA